MLEYVRLVCCENGVCVCVVCVREREWCVCLRECVVCVWYVCQHVCMCVRERESCVVLVVSVYVCIVYECAIFGSTFDRDQL